MRPSSFILFALLTACSTNAAPPKDATNGPRESEPIATAPSAPAPASSGANVVLQSSASTAVFGDRVTLSLINKGNAPFTFTTPGGTNGCARFHWSVSLMSDSGEAFLDPSMEHGQMCTAVMVMPETITIAPGDKVDLALDTGASFGQFSTGGGLAWTEKQLTPGTYKVSVSGGTLQLETTLVIKKR
jgi:hypothetical protein